MSYQPGTNPMDPNPDYVPSAFTFDESWFESASPQDIGVGCKEAIIEGINVVNLAVGEKYKDLQGDLMEALGQATGKAPAKE